MGREDLTSKLLRIVCCRDGCTRAMRHALGTCGDCCADCLLAARGRCHGDGGGCCNIGGGGSSRLNKQEIEYVISNTDQCPTGTTTTSTTVAATASTTKTANATPAMRRWGSCDNGNDRGGCVNEACTEANIGAPSTTSSAAGSRRTTIAYDDEKDIKNELYQKIMMRRSSSVSTTTPIIDWKSVQFWTLNTNKEAIQPLSRRPSLDHSTHLAVHSFKPQLYEVHEHDSSDTGGGGSGSGSDCVDVARSRDNLGSRNCDASGIRGDLTDDEKLEKFGLGQVHFSVHYDVGAQLLLVKVIEARDLARPLSHDATKQDMSHSNPYVRVCLLPDQKNARQTAVRRKTQCPVFDETFAFELPFREVQMRTLQLKVKDFDRYSRHCLLGHALQPLVNLNLIKGLHMWKPLLPCEKDQPDLGDILISLNYLPSAGRLNVDVIKAKQLQQTDLVGGSVPFVRVSLVTGNKHWKTKKTSHKKNTVDPVFNESFSFNVTPAELSDVSIVITAWDSNSGLTSRDDFIGRVVLGRHASGPDEFTHWDRMLRTHRSPVAQWHTLRSRQQADQSSPASLLVP